jgi:hypothetical protein
MAIWPARTDVLNIFLTSTKTSNLIVSLFINQMDKYASAGPKISCRGKAKQGVFLHF